MANDKIEVFLKPPSGTDGWLMKLPNGGWTAGPTYPQIDVAYKHKADITFTIQNGPGQNVTFASTPFLTPPKVSVFSDLTGGGASFTITDHNPHNEDIPYVLMFNGGVPKLDPIIDNGGGNFTNSITLQYVEAGGILLLSLVVGMFIQKAFRLMG